MDFTKILAKLSTLDDSQESKQQLTESKLDECGSVLGTTPEQDSGMSINTSIDTRTGSKTVSVSASGDAADDLMQVLKLSGLTGETQVVVATDEAVEEEYANEPNPEIQPVDTQLRQGTDLNKEKTMVKHNYRGGDNPFAMQEAAELAALESSLMEELNSIKVNVEEAKDSLEKRITAKKYMGDDAHSWAVFVDGKAFVTGLGKSEVAYYKRKALEMLKKKEGVAEGKIDDLKDKQEEKRRESGEDEKKSNVRKIEGHKYGGSKQKEKDKEEVDEAKMTKKKMSEADVEEGNEFSGELAKAKAAGKKEFKVAGKTYPVKEARK